MSEQFNVVVVGAGAAGIGMALTLQRIPNISFTVLEAGSIGESFKNWPLQTRFITPSFQSNSFGLADLNAVNEISSPAIHSGAEHLSGHEYASYLSFMAEYYKLPVREQCKVEAVEKISTSGFRLKTSQGEIKTKFLIWATGEYQFPDLQPFSGAKHCIHYANVSNWEDFSKNDYVVIGGYESGIDSTVNLVNQGSNVTLLVRKDSWEQEKVYDPSLTLSPYSRQRIYKALDTGRLEICFSTDVNSVIKNASGSYEIIAEDTRRWVTTERPIIGTGFIQGGGASQIKELWSWNDDGNIELTVNDESALTPGLFLVGPSVRHTDIIYCFIYKFRQRFGLIAHFIAESLHLDSSNVLPPSSPWGPFGNSECCEGCEC